MGKESDGCFTHDVFLSFRGVDTRDPLIGHLLKSFLEKGINVFFDEDNLEIGKDISSTLLRAIEESKILIIVFSQNYASSTWCLRELEKIIACTENNKKHLAFPIFYHVNPSDIRNQNNSYGQSMIHHENLYGKESEKIQAWRSALSKAGHLSGHHIHTGSEAKHIEEIVEKVCARIAPKPLHVDDDLVGLGHRVEKVKSILGLKDDDRCMLGIYGPGGIGKTELSKALYNKIAHEFDVACFLANVGVNSKKKGIEYLQKTLISEMSEPLKCKFGSTCKGISEMKKRFQHKKVLLVLDGVDNIEQLNVLAGKANWFGFGSRIIVTTREKSLVGRHQFEKFSYYKMTGLNDQHSLELFCQKAFKKSHPKRGYEDVSARAVNFGKGLPLAIKAMASILSTKKGVEAWENAMDDFERIPDKIQDLLRVNIDAFKHYAQTAFIDIGCLSNGERKEYKNNIRTNRVNKGSECIGLNKYVDYYYQNAEKDTKTNWMVQEFCPPPYNCTNTVQQLSAGTTFRSYDCKICKKGLTSFQALGGHMKSHKRSARAEAITKAIARAKESINMPNNSREEEVSPLSQIFNQMSSHTNYKPKLSDSAPEPVTKPTKSSSSTYYNQNTTSIWSKNGLDTCKFLLIFKNGEVLDFQRLDNVDVIL